MRVVPRPVTRFLGFRISGFATVAVDQETYIYIVFVEHAFIVDAKHSHEREVRETSFFCNLIASCLFKCFTVFEMSARRLIHACTVTRETLTKEDLALFIAYDDADGYQRALLGFFAHCGR